MYDVFIAYVPTDSHGCATPDSRAVQELYDRFSSTGIAAFLSFGSAPAEAVEEALQTAKVMVVTASCRAYVEAQQERLEWSRFIEQMQTRRGLRLITLFDGFDASAFPVSMEPSGLLPTQFFGASNYGFDQLDKAFDKALKVIGKNAVTEPAAASVPSAPAQYSPNAKNGTAVIPQDTTAAPQSGSVKQLIPTIIVASVLIAGLLLSISCLSCVFTGIFGTAAKPPRGLKYRLQGDTCIITDYNGFKKSLVIPQEIKGATVTTIGLHAFRDCRNLKSITLPDSVTEIEDEAFKNCRYLKSVTLPDGLTTLGEQAFAHCLALDEIVLPDGLNEIGTSAFYDCTALKTVSLPDDLTVLGAGAFKACTALTDVRLPDSLTEIGNYAFSECTALTDVRLPEGLALIGNGTFNGCRSLTDIVIPDGVTSIVEDMFYGCDTLKSITIPESITVIGANAFFGCYALTNVILPDNITTIGENAFYFCIALTDMTLPTGLTTIGDGSFACCLALTDITLPDSLTTIGEGAFGCRIDIASAGDGFGYKTITVHAPHDADFYGYDPDDGVNWVIDK